MQSFSNFIINKNNLINNVKNIKKVLNPNCKLCVMLKANAYGHGALSVAKILQNYADFFGVANVLEAEYLRNNKIKNNILVVSVPYYNSYIWCANNNVSVTCASLFELNEILKQENILKYKIPLKIHLKINSGLNRIGFNNVKDVLKAVKLINECGNVFLQGVFTHFATKDNDEFYLNYQYKVFNKYVNLIKKHSTNKCIIIHCCNSYAAICKNKFNFDMVRCGFATYGYLKSEKVVLKPVLSINSKISFISYVKPNSTVGYDRTYITNKFSKLAVVPLGYADGFDRRLSNNFSVLVNGYNAPVVGNICMDVFIIDVTNIKNVKVGTVVTILGRSNNKCLSLENYAKALKTSEYECLLKFKYNRMNYKIV